jgi:hypothetical protein
MTEYRNCQFCKRQSAVYVNMYVLFKYGVRHYAHAICLAKAKGEKGAEALIPEHERKDYRFAISLEQPKSWERSLAKSVDLKNRLPGEVRR